MTVYDSTNVYDSLDACVSQQACAVAVYISKCERIGFLPFAPFLLTVLTLGTRCRP